MSPQREVSIDPLRLEPALRLLPIGRDRFIAATLSPNMDGVIFGGQYLANVLGAAYLTAEDRRPHMMQAFFLRAADLKSPLELNVTRVRDGARLSHRRVEMYQRGRLLMTADVSLYSGSGVNAHQFPPPLPVPLPETLVDLKELVVRHGDQIDASTRQRVIARKALLIRPVDAEAGITHSPTQPKMRLWLKPAIDLPDDSYFHYTALTYLSDFGAGGISNSLHKSSMFSAHGTVLSLNHSLWFHGHPRIDDWLLYELESPKSGNGLGLGMGRLLDRRGQLLAVAVQEALLPA